jgi:predicted HTH transcriptional regulator
VFTEYSGGFSVTFKFKEPIGYTAPKKELVITLTARQQTILAFIKKQGAVSLQQIMNQLDHPHSERMVRRDLNLLKKAGLPYKLMLELPCGS